MLAQVTQVRWQLCGWELGQEWGTEGNPCQVEGTGCGLLYLLGMPWDASTPAVLGTSCLPASQSCCSAPPASVCSQKIPIIGASSALRHRKKNQKKQPKSRENGKETPPAQSLFEAGRRGGESSFSLQKAAAPQEERHQIKCSRVDAETLRKKIKKKMLAQDTARGLPLDFILRQQAQPCTWTDGQTDPTASHQVGGTQRWKSPH